MSQTELRLFEEACANRDNPAARDLLNVFGANTAGEILAHLTSIPATLRVEMMDQIRKAMEAQRLFRPAK